MSGVWLKQTDLPLNGVSEKEKERCDLGAMTERLGVFSAGATGVLVTTTNIVLDESYKTMNQSALSSSPAQNQDHNATNNMYNTVTATSANININSIFPQDYSDFDYSQSGGESPQPPLFGFPAYNSQSDGESLRAIRRSGASDSESQQHLALWSNSRPLQTLSLCVFPSSNQ